LACHAGRWHYWRAIRAGYLDQPQRSGKSSGGRQFATWAAAKVSFAKEFTGWKNSGNNCQVGLLLSIQTK
jgi:hypothetical protein